MALFAGYPPDTPKSKTLLRTFAGIALLLGGLALLTRVFL